MNPSFLIAIAPTSHSQSVKESVRKLCSRAQAGSLEILRWVDLSELPLEREARTILVVDAHASNLEVAEFFGSLANKKQNVVGENCIVFVSAYFSTPTPPFDSEFVEEVQQLRDNQFFFRMVSAYGWGGVCKLANLDGALVRFCNVDAVSKQGEFEPMGQKKYSYPILDFLRSGLDVSINTDNRSLHWGETLTDDYLQAARLVNGLTRWDVLRICKNGLKNAFLPKDQLAALIKHAEYEIYGMVSELSGENAFPAFERGYEEEQQR